eukprot:scaffold48_cov122-Skeletonema_menzelii.AAC.4
MSQRNSTIDTANEEWHEMITSEAPTFASRQLSPANPTPKVVEVSNSLSAQDLKSLKKRDPFLYYSIPGVRDATVCLERRHASSSSGRFEKAIPIMSSTHANFIDK